MQNRRALEKQLLVELSLLCFAKNVFETTSTDENNI